MRPLANGFRALLVVVLALTSTPAAHAGGAIASGATVAGNLTSPGFSETWTFTGATGDHVVFAATTPGGAVSMTLTLKAPGGAVATSTGANRVDYTLTASGTWTIVIDDLTASTATTYSLTLLDLSGTLTSAGDADGGAITSNQVRTGTTNAGADLDAFTFSGATGDRVVLTAVGTGGASYTAGVYLYPPGGGSYVTASFSGRLEYQLPAAGTYIAVVQDQALTHTGTYAVSLLNVTSGPLTTGADTDGGPIASGAIAGGTISGPGDLDGFTFSGTNGDHVILAAVATGGTLNTNLTLYPPGGGAAIVATSSDRVDAQLTATGTWTVVIEDVADSAPGTYRLAVTDLAGPLTNAGDADGGPITSHQVVTGTTGAVGDLDAFTFTATSGDRVVLTATATDGAAYTPAVYLYPPGGGSYLTATIGGRIDYQVNATGTYVAVVQDQTLLDTGGYALSFLDVTSGPLTTVSDGDGGPIVSGTIKTGTISGPGDLDGFTFTGTSGDHVILAAITTSGSLNTNVNLYPPGGGAAIAATSSDRVDATLTATGTWTIVVEDAADAAAGTYSLALTDLAGPLTSAGDLDGGAIVSNQPVTGTTSGVGDLDAWTFTGTAGDRVLLTSVGTGGAGYTSAIFLYPPGGGSYVAATFGGRIDYQLAATGTYVAVVQDQTLLHSGAYTLSLLDVTAGPLTSGSDTDGGPIVSGTIKTGTIGGPGDFDGFTFTGASGERVVLAAIATSGALNTNLSLYPPGGGTPIVNSSSDRVDAMLTASGTWTVVVEDAADVAAGTYSLSFTDLSGALTSGGDLDGGPIASNQVVAGATNVLGDFDAYTFLGFSGDRILLTAVRTGGVSYIPAIYLYPPGGGSYVTATFGGRIDYQLTSSGTFVAVVQDQNLVNTGTYALSFLNVIGGPVVSVADPDGGVIHPGDVKSGQITGVGDFDTYWFTGAAGETAHLTAVTTAGALNTNLSIYPENGGPAAQSTSADNLSYMLPTTGRYAVVIEDATDNHTGSYQLALTGALSTVGVPGGPAPLDPTRVVLEAPRPNPAQGPAELTFSLPVPAAVELSVYDTRGALVRTLDHGTFAAGAYARTWDGRDARGQRVRAGVYFSELRAGSQTLRRAMVRLD